MNNREIKFRGQKVGKGKWVYGSYIRVAEPTTKNKLTFKNYILTGSMALFQGYWILKRILIFEKTVGQYTGLKDKNGKEIYFKDFVKKNNIIYLVVWNIDKINLLDISNGDIIKIDNNLIIKSNLYENKYKFNPKYTKIS